MPVNRLFSERSIPCPTGERLHALLMSPAQAAAERLVFLVPLVGSSASQQILMFKGMVKRGSALLSFEYRGHGRSTGNFSVEKSLEDSRTVYAWAAAHALQQGIPLHVLSNCYGTLAMLSWFRGPAPAPAPATLSAVSGLIDMHQIIRAGEFLACYGRLDGGSPRSVPDFLDAVTRGAVDVQGAVFRRALMIYLQGLFPELKVSPEEFEQLAFGRVDMAETLRQFLTMGPLEGVSVPAGVPSLFYYGLRDDIMGLDLAGTRQQYEQRLLTLAPHAEVRSADVDHFGRGLDRDRIVQQLADFHRLHDRSLLWPRVAASSGSSAA